MNILPESVKSHNDINIFLSGEIEPIDIAVMDHHEHLCPNIPPQKRLEVIEDIHYLVTEAGYTVRPMFSSFGFHLEKKIRG